MNASELVGLRPLLFSIAYRMLARVGDAEDVVQEAFLRYQSAVRDGVEVESPKAYLSAVAMRLAIDQLRSARRRRESYVGEWLPEPILTDEADPARATEEADSLSMAFLLVLERLGPVERAVFLLHDVFAYDYDEIAGIVGKTAANCRQIAVRARQHVEAENPRFEASRRARDRLAERFFAAVNGGRIEELVALLADDVVVVGDGGGKAPQWARPIVGPKRVAALFVGLSRQIASLGITIERHEINGRPGAILRDRNAQVVNVFMLDMSDDAIQTIRSVINPDKLRHLGPVADARALARELRRP